MQYNKFKGLAIVIGGGGVGDENCGRKKIKNYEVGWLFFDIYQHLAEPDDEADQPRSAW